MKNQELSAIRQAITPACKGNPEADLVFRGQRAGCQQHWRGGQRNPQLLNQYPDEEKQITVSEENLDRERHGESPVEIPD